MREPLVPVETMEKKQQVAAFAWEPSGDRFALVLGDVPKLEVTFYTMKVRVSDQPLVKNSATVKLGLTACFFLCFTRTNW